jgi:hypothetical protein
MTTRYLILSAAVIYHFADIFALFCQNEKRTQSQDGQERASVRNSHALVSFSYGHWLYRLSIGQHPEAKASRAIGWMLQGERNQPVNSATSVTIRVIANNNQPASKRIYRLERINKCTTSNNSNATERSACVLGYWHVQLLEFVAEGLLHVWR